MADYPDVFADGFSLTAGQFGITLTLSRSEPTGEAGPHDEPQVIVARIRMTQSLAEAIAETIHQMAAMAAQGGPQTGTSIKH
jgi:hypothetical protein